MKMRKAAAFLTLFLLTVIPAVSQEDETVEEEQGASIDFFLIPILETFFSGNPDWSPNWPDDIPPDSFFLPEGNSPRVIELSNGDDSFAVRRDDEGRLVEFPFFYEDRYAKITVGYSQTGSPQTMLISFKNFASQDEDSQEEEETWNFTFPADFLPYGQTSGGSFPPITVTSDDSGFFVFIFESPVFLTETWYDSDGNMLAFCKASVIEKDGAWRITSLHIYEESGVRFEDRYFDSFGNTTEIRFSDNNIQEADTQDRIFSALYRDRTPIYWRRGDLRNDLQWDTRGILTIVKATGSSEDLSTEYRYEYEFDAFGNWIKRQETAYRIQFDLLAANPLYSRGIWNRRIEYFEDGNGERYGRQ